MSSKNREENSHPSKLTLNLLAALGASRIKFSGRSATISRLVSYSSEREAIDNAKLI